MKKDNYYCFKALLCLSSCIITIFTTSFTVFSFKSVNEHGDVMLVRKTLDSLYSAFSFKSDHEPDWNMIRHLTLKGAAFVSAPSNNAKRLAIDIEQFIKEYKSDIIKLALTKTGYSEHIIKADIQKTGNVATAVVTFKAFIKSDKRNRRPGLDNIQLLFDQGAWKIVAFTTQSESTAL